MNYTRPYPFGKLGHAQHRTTVVIELDDVPVFNAACFSIRRVKAHSSPRVAIFKQAMPRNFLQPGRMSVMMGVKGKS